jgi:hypothetical protein
MHGRNKLGEDGLSFDPYDDIDPHGRGYNSPRSPNNLNFARSHEELAGRSDPPLSSGLSLREPLETEDYWNRD